MKKRTRFLLLIGLLLSTPLDAFATFAINIKIPGGSSPYGGAGLTIVDNGPGDSSPLPNVIVAQSDGFLNPLIPGFSFSIDTAVTNTPGGPLNSLLDLHYLLLATTGGTVTVTASATGFTFPGSGGALLTSAIGGSLSPPASVQAQQWINLTNTLFGMEAITTGIQGPFSTTSYSDTATLGFMKSGAPYSITEQLVETLGPGGFDSGDLQSTVVPAPATLLLLGASLTGVTFVGRLRGRGKGRRGRGSFAPITPR